MTTAIFAFCAITSVSNNCTAVLLAKLVAFIQNMVGWTEVLLLMVLHFKLLEWLFSPLVDLKKTVQQDYPCYDCNYYN